MSEAARAVRSIDIWPHRSLDGRGAAALLAGLAALLALGVLRAPAGARGVIILGSLLTLALMAGALWLNTRAAAAVERIEIGPEVVRVVHIDRTGAFTAVEFRTPWVRVVVKADRRADPRVTLEESGRRAAIGNLLSPAEREGLAVAIREAIAEARRVPASSALRLDEAVHEPGMIPGGRLVQ